MMIPCYRERNTLMSALHESCAERISLARETNISNLATLWASAYVSSIISNLVKATVQDYSLWMAHHLDASNLCLLTCLRIHEIYLLHVYHFFTPRWRKLLKTSSSSNIWTFVLYIVNTVAVDHLRPGGRLNKKDGLTRYGDSHVKDKTS